MNSRHFQRLQPHWDARAAGNFICGGAGAGLVAATSLHAMDVPGAQLRIGVGLALVALGLFFVWLEIGRPLRALNVFANLRRSWMSREALAALALFLLASGLVAGLPWPAWPAGVAALVFLYCQARILREARGIPAWRAALTLPLVMVTGLVEGIGLFWLLAAWSQPPALLALPLAGLAIVRWVLWAFWRRSLRPVAAPPALRAIDGDAWVLQWVGCVAPVTLAALAASGLLLHEASAILLALAGGLAAAAGARFKFTLVTRAAHQQGFALPHLPVRGVPRTTP